MDQDVEPGGFIRERAFDGFGRDFPGHAYRGEGSPRSRLAGGGAQGSPGLFEFGDRSGDRQTTDSARQYPSPDMRIAYLANSDGNANGFYRGVGPMDDLAHRGHLVHQLSRLAPSARFDVVRAVDVFHVHRYCDEHTIRLMREAKAQGAAVVWDDDDDLLAMGKESPSHGDFTGLRREQRIAAMRHVFELADLVTATNATLARRFREAGARRTVVIENHVPAMWLLPRDERPREGLTIGWVAGREHRIDRDGIPIVATLSRLLGERPGLHVVSIGLKLQLDSPRYRNISSVHVLSLADHAATFDVGIAPLADTPFNRSKSNVKVKEYAAGGTPWLASPVGPYVDLGERQGGRLVADDGWYEALSRVLDKPRARAKLAKRARAWAAGQTLEANGQRWEQAFAQAVAAVGERAAIASA